MTVWDWIVSVLCVLVALVGLAAIAAELFGEDWIRERMRDKRQHPPRAERIALMQRLREESGYDPSLPREPK